MMCQPSSSSMRWMVTAAGGAPAVMTPTPLGANAFASAGELASMISTVGAAHILVTRSSAAILNTVAASNFGRHTCLAPAAVTVHVNVQPLAWNIGSVHRYMSAGVIGQCASIPTVFIHAFRCVIMTPLGRDVVPLV